jgi:hypothetical protein
MHEWRRPHRILGAFPAPVPGHVSYRRWAKQELGFQLVAVIVPWRANVLSSGM